VYIGGTTKSLGFATFSEPTGFFMRVNSGETCQPGLSDQSITPVYNTNDVTEVLSSDPEWVPINVHGDSITVTFLDSQTYTPITTTSLSEYADYGWPCPAVVDYTFTVTSEPVYFEYEVDVSSTIQLLISEYFEYSLMSGDSCNEFSDPNWINYSAMMSDNSPISAPPLEYEASSNTLDIETSDAS